MAESEINDERGMMNDELKNQLLGLSFIVPHS
jgi:hypothetical protein